MSYFRGNIGDFGMDTVSLAGPLAPKLQAIRAAGFSQVMLSAEDLVAHPEGFEAAVAAVRASGLRVTGLQALRDYEGLSGPMHAYKVDIAKAMLEMCRALGSRLLIVNATTVADASRATDALVRDLRQLAMLAIPMNIRVAFKPLFEASHLREFPEAWNVVGLADIPNLGLCIGAWDLCAANTSLEEFDFLDPEKIFLVQLSDALKAQAPQPAQTLQPHLTARPFRVFPGEGVHTQALAVLVARLHALGYRGTYSFDAANDDYRQLPVTSVAQRAWRCAVWLGEDVLRRSVPLPNKLRLKS